MRRGDPGGEVLGRTGDPVQFIIKLNGEEAGKPTMPPFGISNHSSPNAGTLHAMIPNKFGLPLHLYAMMNARRVGG